MYTGDQSAGNTVTSRRAERKQIVTGVCARGSDEVEFTEK